MTRLYIVRHGNTFDKGDTVTRVGARTDLALSKSGKAQASALAEYFRGAGCHFTRIISGPLKRTLETAADIVARQPDLPDVEIAAFLREIDYGPDENKPEADVIARIGQPALDAWEHRAVPPPGWQVDPAKLTVAWKTFFETLAGPGADSLVLAVTSNGIARFALLAAGVSTNAPDGPVDLKLKTGAYGVLDIGPDASVNLLDWNVRPAV